MMIGLEIEKVILVASLSTRVIKIVLLISKIYTEKEASMIQILLTCSTIRNIINQTTLGV